MYSNEQINIYVRLIRGREKLDQTRAYWVAEGPAHNTTNDRALTNNKQPFFIFYLSVSAACVCSTNNLLAGKMSTIPYDMNKT